MSHFLYTHSRIVMITQLDQQSSFMGLNRSNHASLWDAYHTLILSIKSLLENTTRTCIISKDTQQNGFKDYLRVKGRTEYIFELTDSRTFCFLQQLLFKHKYVLPHRQTQDLCCIKVDYALQGAITP